MSYTVLFSACPSQNNSLATTFASSLPSKICHQTPCDVSQGNLHQRKAGRHLLVTLMRFRSHAIPSRGVFSGQPIYLFPSLYESREFGLQQAAALKRKQLPALIPTERSRRVERQAKQAA